MNACMESVCAKGVGRVREKRWKESIGRDGREEKGSLFNTVDRKSMNYSIVEIFMEGDCLF